MSAPTTLVELYKEAAEEIGDELATWAFRYAKARGRVLMAEKALAHLQALDRDTHVAAFGCSWNETMRESVLNTGPHPTALANAIDMLTEAVEWEAACATVLRLVETRPSPVAKFTTVAGGKR